MKKEVLLEDVQSLKFWFFIAPDKKWQLDSNNQAQTQPPSGQTTPPANNQGTPTQAKPEIKPSPEGEWINEWSQDFKLLPAIIRLEIKRDNKTEYFAFPLSKCKRQPVYNQ